MTNPQATADDLSMLINTGIVLQRLFTFSTSRSYTIAFTVVLTVSLLAIASYHCITDEWLVHVVTFGLMVHVIGMRTRAMIQSRVADRETRKRIGRLAAGGAISFLSGFAIWILDHLFCDNLIGLRHRVGMPWGFLVEFHGWSVFDQYFLKASPSSERSNKSAGGMY
jgi:dihydroceramidase